MSHHERDDQAVSGVWIHDILLCLGFCVWYQGATLENLESLSRKGFFDQQHPLWDMGV